MMRAGTLIGALLALATSTLAADRKVFAHYMLGTATTDQWASAISAAQAAGIDAFALNTKSDYTDAETALSQAYTAAETAEFEMFISFDMDSNTYPVDTVVSWINKFKDSSAQFKVDDRPFVSTFAGADWFDNWGSVIDQTGSIFLVPSYTYDGGPDTIGADINGLDGAFNWEAWPKSSGKMTNDSDIAYMDTLGDDKAFMMGVSPWMYTDLPEIPKNWLLQSDTLFYDRWEQVMDLLPDYVEIITWNDAGESHYIGTLGGVDDETAVYTDNIPHESWQKVLPYYIAAYKAGTRDTTIDTDVAVFWYRTTAKDICSDGGTTCGSESATECTTDTVNVLAISSTATTATVSIGSYSQDFDVAVGANMFQLPFDGNTGDVVVTMNGQTGTGAVAISSDCPSSGHVNFNPVVGATS